MGFTCDNELRVRGGSAEDRRKALSLALAEDCVTEEGATISERPAGGEGIAAARFQTRDGLLETVLMDLARAFPDLGFALAYLSLDGEFMGAFAAEGEKAASDSADLDEGDRATIDRLHGLDPVGYARERFAEMLEARDP